MIRSLILSMGTDPNGEALRYKAAADRHGGAAIRAVTRSTHSFKHLPVDILYAGNQGAVRRLWAEADVVHLNNNTQGFELFDDGSPKAILLHHHGAAFRTNPEPLHARAVRRGWVQAASTLDLVELAPETITWLPTAYDLNALAELRTQHRREPDGVLRIAHAPTFRTVKGTAAILAAVDVLQAAGLPIELDLIEHVSWAQCLRRKAAADVFVDQLMLGYGCNAIEAWGMGLPVIAGLDPDAAAAVNHPIPDTTRERMLREFGEMPFYEATAATITDALRALVTSPELRQEWALRGMEHVARFHEESVALERLVAVYERAVGATPAVEAVA